MGLQACGVSKISFQSSWQALEQVPTTRLFLVVPEDVALFPSFALRFLSHVHFILCYTSSRIYGNKLLSTETAQNRARARTMGSLGNALGSEPTIASLGQAQ